MKGLVRMRPPRKDRMRDNSQQRGRKPNPRQKLAMEVRIVDDAVHMPLGLRARALAWLRRWRHRPDRVFWVIRPTGGRRLL